MQQKLYSENEQLQQIETLCNVIKIADSPEELLRKTATLHGEARCTTLFLKSLDLPLEGRRASFTAVLNGEQPLK